VGPWMPRPEEDRGAGSLGSSFREGSAGSGLPVLPHRQWDEDGQNDRRPDERVCHRMGQRPTARPRQDQGGGDVSRGLISYPPWVFTVSDEMNSRESSGSSKKNNAGTRSRCGGVSALPPTGESGVEITEARPDTPSAPRKPCSRRKNRKISEPGFTGLGVYRDICHLGLAIGPERPDTPKNRGSGAPGPGRRA